MGTAGVKTLRDREADARSASGDEGDLSFE
jgi:hypothetical protein